MRLSWREVTLSCYRRRRINGISASHMPASDLCNGLYNKASGSVPARLVVCVFVNLPSLAVKLYGAPL